MPGKSQLTDAEAFDHCGTLLAKIARKGWGFDLTNDDIASLARARKLVTQLVHELSAPRLAVKRARHIRSLLRKLHTDVDYSRKETFIFAIAHLGLVLVGIEGKVEHPDDEVRRAAKLCNALSHEFE